MVRRAQAGDLAARQRLVDLHHGLAYHIAATFYCSGFEFEDLLQEGLLGVLRAIDRFDPGRGCRFATYATYWVRQGIQRSIERHGRLIGLPVDLIHSLRRIETAHSAFVREHGYPPDSAELAEAAGVSQRRLTGLLSCVEAPLSLDSMAGENEERKCRLSSGAAANPEEAALRSAMKEEVRHWLATLSQEDRLVLQGRYGLSGIELTPQEFLSRHGLDHQAVRRIERRALRRLRSQLARRAELATP
jgi:RNA polymerase sigma factor (sigma-70 family)